MNNNTQSVSIKELIENKKKADAEYQQELQQRMDKLIELIPEGLKTCMLNETNLNASWLEGLYSNTLNGTCNDIKIKSPEDYGFKSKKNVAEKFKALIAAWKGQVDIKINTKEWYAKIEFRYPLDK